MSSPEQCAAWRVRNKETAKVRQRIAYAKRKETGKYKTYYAAHREEYLRRARENPDKVAMIKASMKKYYSKYKAAYMECDWYIRFSIVRNVGLSNVRCVPPALVEAKLAHLKVKRLTQEMKHENNG